MVPRPGLVQACSSLLLPAFILLLATVGSAQHVSTGRRLLIRPLPSGGGTCKNTYQGPFLMADDKGKVCTTKELDFFTGCCKDGQQHACDKCGKDDSCCESFEHCVSCCLAPDNKPEEKRKTYPRVPHSKEPGVWDTPFDYCMAVCRTHVFSTSHENAYISARHHCFSKLGKPLLSPPLPAGTLDGVSLVLSAAGSSCASMCEQQGMACSQKHLHHVNSCDRLREVGNCEAGCVEEEHAEYLPAAVDPEAPKANRPALCLVSSKGTAAAEGFTCEASENYMRRLCPCVKGTASSSTSSSSTVKGSGSKDASGEKLQAGSGSSSSKSDAGSAAAEPAKKDSSSSSSTEAAAGTAAAAAAAPEKGHADGPDQLGATQQEGSGADSAGDADAVVDADAQADLREYEDDPDRGEGE